MPREFGAVWEAEAVLVLPKVVAEGVSPPYCWDVHRGRGSVEQDVKEVGVQ